MALCLERGAAPGWRDEGDPAACGATALQVAVCGGPPAGPPRPGGPGGGGGGGGGDGGGDGAGDGARPEDLRLGTVQGLLEAGADPEAPDYAESTALHFAAALGDAGVIRALLAGGASARATDAEGLSALHLAANNGHLAAARALTENWAPVDLADPGDTSHAGAGGGDPTAARERRQRVAPEGASLYVAKRGTALHVCAAANRLAVATHLVEVAGADVNSPAGAHGATPLHVACRCGHAAVAGLLLRNGADRDARDEQGDTPLHRAVEGGHVDLARRLLRGREATAAATRNAAGLTPLHVAAACGAGGVALVDLLVERGAPVDARCAAEYQDWDGSRTPLHYAAHRGDAACFDRLLALGADPCAVSTAGWPALFYAVEAGHLELAGHIMDLHAEEGLHFTDPAGRPPLAVAALQDLPEMARMLAGRHPFSLHLRDARGRTALHWAASRGHGRVMEVLVELGARGDVRDGEGKTPGELVPYLTRPAPRRQWEEERTGPEGEARWDYAATMEATQFRYMRKVMAARRVREVARERQCGWCKRYSFDAARCGGCKLEFYCNSDCQRLAWTKGGHRLVCAAAGMKKRVFPVGIIKE